MGTIRPIEPPAMQENSKCHIISLVSVTSTIVHVYAPSKIYTPTISKNQYSVAGHVYSIQLSMSKERIITWSLSSISISKDWTIQAKENYNGPYHFSLTGMGKQYAPHGNPVI